MIRLLFIYIAFLSFAIVPGAIAQQPNTKGGALRQRLADAKFDYVKQKLVMSDADAEKLKPIYVAYEREQAQLGKLKELRIDNISADSLSTQEAEKVITDRFDFAQKQLDLRKKYYVEFKKVLTPQQVIKLYQAEADIRQKVMLELRNRKMRMNGQNPQQ
jgi:hypothetical protein